MVGSAAVDLVTAQPSRMDEVRELFREYAAFLSVDLCFQDFEAELAALPGKYAPPHGCILLAEDAHGRCAGVVAMRPLDTPGQCEMKRLYVRPPWRGTGLGRRLAEAIVEQAREVGYREMVLDTLARLEAAVALYESIGFVRRTPYYDNPLEDVIYMTRRLDR